MANRLKYIITCSVDAEDSYLERVCDSFEEAITLLETLYEDAENSKQGKLGKVTNPKWINPYTLQVTFQAQCGHVFVKEWRTYQIHNELESNIYSKTPWITY